jgi:hypothetical protein
MPLTLTRTIVGILIPGIIALSPWAIWAMVSFPKLADNYDKLTTLVSAVLTGAVIIVGATIEGVATRVEAYWDKQRAAGREYQVFDDWYWYLAQTFHNEPVGYKYLSRAVTTLYFELGMAFSSPIALLGFSAMILTHQPTLWSVRLAFTLPVLATLLALFYRAQAYDTHELLCETRKQLRVLMAPTVELEAQNI